RHHRECGHPVTDQQNPDQHPATETSENVVNEQHLPDSPAPAEEAAPAPAPEAASASDGAAQVGQEASPGVDDGAAQVGQEASPVSTEPEAEPAPAPEPPPAPK